MHTTPTKTLAQAVVGLAVALAALAAYATALYLILIAIASVASAGMPPSRYDRPYDGYLIPFRVELGQAARTCNALARQLGQPATHPRMIEGRHLYGCAYPAEGLCYVVYSYDPSGKDKRMESNVWRHEIAHCNGWPAHHPGQR
jgi:hypothetical protein